MQTKFGKWKKLGLSALMVCSIVIILVLVVPALADDTAETKTNVNCPPPVEVPVVLDGVLYQPDEFNRIHCELNARGINLGSLINPADGVFYAFTSRDDLKEFVRQIGYPSLVELVETVENNAGVTTAVPVTAIEPTPTLFPNGDYPPIEVPIVFDGILYQPDEFNRIQKELYSRYPYAVFCIDPDDGTFFGFSSRERFVDYAKKQEWFSEIKFPDTVEKTLEIMSP